jgi:MFS family permease
LAPALAPPLLTVLMLAFGWRVMFLIAGLAGLAVALAWMIFYRSPEEAGISAAEIAQIRAEDQADTMEGGSRIVWLLQFRTTWAMFFGFFGVVYISWLYATWLPGYLETQRHLSVASAGLWSAVPMLSGFVGAVAGGFMARALGRIGMAPGPACLAPIVVGMILAGLCTIAGALVTSMDTAIALMAAGLFGANVASSCGWALAALIAPNRSVATLEAIQNIGGSLGGTLAPFITGVAVQGTGSFVPGFILGGVIALASAAIYWTGARRSLGNVA